ncbi:LacI family DNA-binding transcriptional regulator [Aliiroseovarius sp. Z3]|uniref:LacI family DNA-binding transcriptional regulator n=1 Tax=Aliiroseovarius sp. Z3 TaxID=2811402 RepID=UPI0023B286DA|nr:LacI family DNA-binding transcriptional regulator [Aliiroseovarius sp. Z3]MDE9449419.1 LacI family DNA-binding transcriptional regulator [Aliiroseovarius sp. Z3]
MPKQNIRPTQRTIADRLGISVGAVSRALANDAQMSEETRASVRKTAEELGYTPDRAAQRLRTGRTYVIHLILPPHNEILGFGNLLVGGISAGLVDTPFDLLVWPDHGNEQSLDRIERIVRCNLADGIIFSRTSPDDSRIRFLSEAGFPFATHGRSEFATPHAFVDYDNHAFGKQAAEKMIERGAKRLAILLPDDRFMFHHHLLHGFMAAVRAAGVDYEVLDGISLDSGGHEISDQLRNRLSKANPPDGLIFPGDVSALAGLAAIQDRGLTVGRDVHVMVKQTSGVFDLVRPCVDSLHEDLSAAGRSLAQIIVDRINGVPAGDLQRVLPVLTTPDHAPIAAD